MRFPGYLKQSGCRQMEEADALCNRIGIMAGGGLRCLGTQIHLKNKVSTQSPRRCLWVHFDRNRLQC